MRYEWILPGGEKHSTSSISYQFKAPGPQPVTVRVTDGIVTVEETLEINITEGEGSVENRAPEVKIRGVLPSTAGDTDTIFSFYADIKDLDQDQVRTYWELGDGAKMTLENIAYQFQEPGSYTVKVMVSDGILQAEDTVTITVVEPGQLTPRNDDWNDTVALEEALEADLALVIQDTPEGTHSTTIPKIRISSANVVVRDYNLFDPTLRTILQKEYDDRKEKLDKVTDEERLELETEMLEIVKKIEQLESNAFFIRGEFKEGRVVELIGQRDIQVNAFKNERSSVKRKEIQATILEISREIKNLQLGVSDDWLIEDILKEAKSSREGMLPETQDTESRRILLEEIQIIEQALSQLRNNPFLARTPDVRALLVALQAEQETALEQSEDQQGSSKTWESDSANKRSDRAYRKKSRWRNGSSRLSVCQFSRHPQYKVFLLWSGS